MQINRQRFVAHIYFFFNAVALPFGMLYTQLLAPFFYFNLRKAGHKRIIMPYLFFIIPYSCIHLFLGVHLKSFIVSNTVLFLTYISVYAGYHFISSSVDLPRIFKKLLIANFIMVLVALPVYFTSYRDWMWYRNKFTHSVDGFYRLSLFTYEASYYALMFAPIAFYYLLKLSRSAFNVNSAFVLLITVLPLLLSLSIGVLGAMAFAFGIYYLIHQKEIFFRKSLFVPLFSLVACCFIVFSFLLIFWIDNPLFIRISNIFNGIDTSTNGRTTESIKIGWMVAQLKSTWFGAGVGQVKILAPDIIRSHFGYWGKPEVVRIPNTIGECIAIFGISGFLLKMGVLLFLFFKKKVMNNSYRLLLFLFMFFYQFTGSFVTNIVEYVAWILAFYGHFPEFDTSLTSKLLAEKNSE